MTKSCWMFVIGGPLIGNTREMFPGNTLAKYVKITRISIRLYFITLAENNVRLKFAGHFLALYSIFTRALPYDIGETEQFA